MTARFCLSSGAWAAATRRPWWCSPGSRRCSSASASSRTPSSWTSPTSGAAGPAKAPSWQVPLSPAGGATWATGPAPRPPPSPLLPGGPRATEATAATRHPFRPLRARGTTTQIATATLGTTASALASSRTWSARVGRRPVLLVSIIFILIFGLTVALSVNVTMFSTLRFFEGFCLAGIILTLYALRIELCPPGKRFMITMVASFVAMAGQFLMPGLAALCRDWQVLQALIICPFLLMLLYWSIFPESLRWLMATQQFEAAKKLILYITQKNCVSPESDIKGVMPELEKELSRRPKKVCIVKVVGTRNLWKNIVVLCVNSLTGYGIHHCFARSMMGHEVKVPLLENFYADYYTVASIALASCLAMCVVVRFLGRRGGLLLFMILTALASLLQLGLLNLIGKYSQHPDSELQLKLAVGMSDSVKDKFSIAFSIVGMFASHAVGSLSVFFCAEITPTVIRCGGLGLVLASAGFGMLTAPIIELHNQKGYFLHHIIFACCTLICIICILLLPESRDQNLPENIANGEHYTRQPLLPHKKGEQPLLLTNAELKDYSGLHDVAAVGDGLPEGATANGMKSM
ncbi:solute carrier family 22 member 23 isoform X3 [Peromyscus californicus insignis]|uniref:solute carrier family 22 member 23 isoform X3 n=1 Tax=Peromyscus californicus insignis TaxID=564181 RepID=UPI0022A6ADA3|nr:solute carrier family 22 member 23 isoform X3 [Peromyscus californicus insignis]